MREAEMYEAQILDENFKLLRAWRASVVGELNALLESEAQRLVDEGCKRCCVKIVDDSGEWWYSKGDYVSKGPLWFGQQPFGADDEEPCRKRTIYVKDSVWEGAKHLGGGNASKGIERALKRVGAIDNYIYG